MAQGFAKFIRSKVFSFLFLVGAVVLMAYFSLRIGTICEFYFDIKCNFLWFGLLALFFGYMLLYHHSSHKIKKTRKLYALCSVIVCFMLNMVICFLVIDCMRIFIVYPNIKVYIIALIGSVVLTIYGMFHARQLVVKDYHIHLDKGVPVQVTLLSDLHIGTFVNLKQLRKIINKTNELCSDYIIIAGDIFDENAFETCDLKKIESALKQLKAKKGIYAVLGNHDPASTNPKVQEFFLRCGIHLLIDEMRETEEFNLIGRDDINANPNRTCLTSLVSSNPSKKIKIVVDHNPMGINEGRINGVDVVLCGHTHKGQFFPANLLTRWSYGKQGFYGISKMNHTYSIVSSGVGVFQIPMRIGSHSEIVRIYINE